MLKPNFTITPPPMTKDRTIVFAQQAFKLPVPPTLGESVSLTPSVPLVQKKAWLSFTGADVGATDKGGFAINFRDPNEVWDISWVTAPTSYLLDCRADIEFASPLPATPPTLLPVTLTYQVWRDSDPPDTFYMNGEVTSTPDGHVLIAIGKQYLGTTLIVIFKSKAVPVPFGLSFFGCDITPVD